MSWWQPPPEVVKPRPPDADQPVPRWFGKLYFINLMVWTVMLSLIGIVLLFVRWFILGTDHAFWPKFLWLYVWIVLMVAIALNQWSSFRIMGEMRKNRKPLKGFFD